MRFKVTSTQKTIRLIDTQTGTAAEIFVFGGLLNAFTIPVKDGLQNLVTGFTSPDDAEENITRGFRSAKLNPFVCRMNKGRYQLAGQFYEVKKHFLQAHAIHGLIYDAMYTVVDEQANDAFASVTLRYRYMASDPGYPFIYDIGISWQLEKNNSLLVTTSITNENADPIPMADGWHPYFTLGGSVDDWTLQFSAAEQLVYDSELIPTGEKTADNRFEKPRSLKDIQLDNGFLFKNPGTKNSCTISDGNLQLTVEPGSSYPVLQVYIPPARNCIAIENLSGAPDNFNNGIGLLVLDPGETRQFSTRYMIGIL